jgi:hypothetical protein
LHGEDKEKCPFCFDVDQRLIVETPIMRAWSGSEKILIVLDRLRCAHLADSLIAKPLPMVISLNVNLRQ